MNNIFINTSYIKTQPNPFQGRQIEAIQKSSFIDLKQWIQDRIDDGSIIAGGGGVPAGSNTQLQFNNAGAFGASANLTWNGSTLGVTGNQTITPSANTVPLTVSGYSLTSTNAQSLLDLSGTWNTSGAPTAIKLNITDTQSNVKSLLADLQVSGVQRTIIHKSGTIRTGYTSSMLSSLGGIAANQYGAVGTNYYLDGLGVLKYAVSDVAAAIDFTGGLNFKAAGAGTADATLSLISRFFVDINGITTFTPANSTATTGTVNSLSHTSTFAAGAGSANFRPLNISYTLNNSGAQTGTATGIYLNATETLLNGMTHNLIDLQVGGTSMFRVNRVGQTALGSSLTVGSFISAGSQISTTYTSTLLTPAITATGAWITGGTSTTTKPHVLIEPTSTTSTNWSTNGTGLGINAASGFTGNLLDLQLNGATRFKINSTGTALAQSINVVNGSNTIDVDASSLRLHGTSGVKLTTWNGISGYVNALVVNSNYGNISLSPATIGYSSGTNTISLLNQSYTVNTTGGINTITGILVNAIETSLTGSTHKLMDLQVGGATKFNVSNTGVVFANNYSVNDVGYFYWNGRGAMSSPADGVITLYNNSSSDFSRLQFGGTTVSYPALKRNTTGLETRLANDSDFASMQSLYHRFGTGSPEGVVTAPVGAFYSRTDGGANTSLYVKESGSGNTGWIAK